MLLFSQSSDVLLSLLFSDLPCVHKFVGKLRLFKPRKAWTSPELVSVSPLAVVGGQETSVLLRGRNLITSEAKYVYAIGFNELFNIFLVIPYSSNCIACISAGLIARIQQTTR